MKVKVEKVNIGIYDYDSIVVDIQNKKTEIVFDKKDNISQYANKEIDLVCENGVYKIKPIFVSSKKMIE